MADCIYFVPKPPELYHPPGRSLCTKCGKPKEAHEHCGSCATCKRFASEWAAYQAALCEHQDDENALASIRANWQSLQPELYCLVMYRSYRRQK